MATLSSEPTSIQSIYNWYREGRLFVNRRYQRKLVWTLEEKQKLIDSILKDYPIPAILLAEKEGKFEIIDGLQRLHAILSFVEIAYTTTDGKVFDLEFFPTAKSHRQNGAFEPNVDGELLENRHCSAILDYSLAASIMRNAADSDVNDVFDRINTYGHRLSDQERRQSGVQSRFATIVREIACKYRGDVSRETLPLYDMPAISIDLPKTKHGYEIRSEEVFWVNQGILRSTDLRDSLDEQCLADIVACVVGQQLISRSKAALDNLYDPGHSEYGRIEAALETYGQQKAVDEINYCIEQIRKVCDVEPEDKLRRLIFSTTNTNPFPSAFAHILIAFHEIIVGEGKVVADLKSLRGAVNNIYDRMIQGQGGATPDQRRTNVDIVKGLIGKHFVIDRKSSTQIYSDHKAVDIEADIRRSEIETSSFELKQGLLDLKEGADDPEAMLWKLNTHICAIENNGKEIGGKIIIGVSDKEEDAGRATKIDKVAPREVGRRYVVGVRREAERMSITMEQYYQLIKSSIANSELSEPLRSSVAAAVDFNSYFGLGVVVISIRPQGKMSYFGEDVYFRSGDETRKAATAKEIGAVAERF